MTATDDRHPFPLVGDLAWHHTGSLDPRKVMKFDGASVWLDISGKEGGPFHAANYTYSTPPARRADLRADALRAALEEARPQRIAQDALAVEEVTTRPMLDALAERLEHTHAGLLLGGQSVERRSHVGLSALEDIRRAATLARDAARYGYPRPALEQLGAQAGHLPAARSTDPTTARDSGERTRSTPSARNHLGKLLVGLLMYEHEEVRRERETSIDEGRDLDMDRVDGALTSEEVAHRVGLGGAEFAKRCSDLLALGYIRVAQDTHGHDRTRRGDSGRQRLVFELTDDGRVMASRISWADEHDRD